MKVSVFSGLLLLAMSFAPGSASANAFNRVTISDFNHARVNKLEALRTMVRGNTFLMWEKGGRLGVYHLAGNGRASFALNGEPYVLKGTWSLSGNKNPNFCLKLERVGKKCYRLSNFPRRWEAGSCNGDHFGLMRANKAPRVVANATNPKSLLRRCRQISGKVLDKALLMARIDPAKMGMPVFKGLPTARDVKTLLSNTTVVSVGRGHGIQVEYHSRNGRTYLAYPKNAHILPGRWSGAKKGKVCYSYGPNTYNPVTGNRSGRNCQFPLLGNKYHCEGDIFKLSKNASNPFGPGKSRARKAALSKCRSLTSAKKLDVIDKYKALGERYWYEQSYR